MTNQVDQFTPKRKCNRIYCSSYLLPTLQAGNGAALYGHFGADPCLVPLGLGSHGLKNKMEWCSAGLEKKRTGMVRSSLGLMILRWL
jgi:hypothetical protein